MSNNFFNQDEPTQPALPHEYKQPGTPSQEKLILRPQGLPTPTPWGQQPPTPQQPPARSYPPAPQQPPARSYPPTPQQPPVHSHQDQPPAPVLNQQYGQQRPYDPNNPPNYPYQQRGSYQQPGQPQGIPPARFSGRARRRRGCTTGCLTVLILLIVVGIIGFGVVQHVMAFGSQISTDKTRSPLSTDNGYMNTADRTNLLVMGYGGGTHSGAYLTDSLLVVSLLPQSHHTSLVSVPRDLFVQYPPNSGQYTKINSVYEFASNNGKDPAAGGSAATQKVALVTGMDVKYWLTIDFTGFKKVIDAIGGIDVYVPDSFNACYPKNDDAAVDPSWIKVQFNKGMQHMDGATAISYARAREPLAVCGMGASENLAELTDFGRSARQQIIVKAVLSQIKQVSTWPRIYSAMDALQQAIHTNMSFADLAAFALKMDLNDPKSARVGLSNQNVLADGSVGGSYVLQPANGDWAAIPIYIKQHLYN